MRREAILHIPVSQYAHGVDERHIVIRLRCGRGDLKSCTLHYGDTGCRVNPMIFDAVPMHVVASDLLHDYWEAVLEDTSQRLFYYFELWDGDERILYYGDVFADHLVEDRSEYFKLPLNHRSDIARVPDWVHEAVVYNIFPDSFATGRRYLSEKLTRRPYGDQICCGKLGGTIRGIGKNADYLQELGINCVYINPIFVAGEYHKYDLLDYFHIDPSFGTDEDFREMVQTMHGHGIRVLIDGVFNHCSWRFFAFEDVVQNGAQSRYKDWFYRLKFPVIRPETWEEYPDYECFGFERMMPKLDTSNSEVRDYFCRGGEYWVEQSDIDGWRLDVASEVDDRFWRAFRQRVKEVKPDALIIGEVWESAGHWLDGTMFDSTMNYDFRKHCRRFFAEGSIDAAAFSGRITDMLMRYRNQLVPAQLNLLDSHDVSRFLSLCHGDQRRYRLAVLFQMCFVGMPTVFYGDELGYHPNVSAQNFARGSTRTVLFLTSLAPNTAFENPHMFEIMSGLEGTLRKRGYSLMLRGTDTTAACEAVEDVIARRSADGLVIHASVMSRPLVALLTRSHFPHIVLGLPNFENQVCWIDINNVYSGTIAANHLIGQGYRKIAFVGGLEYDMISTHRLEGVKQGLENAGRRLDEQ